MFKCTQVVKLSVLDVYETGCTGNYQESVFTYDIKGETVGDVVNQIAAFVGCCASDVEINPCGDDASRIDASRMENADGDVPTTKEYENWTAGNQPLYYVTYSFYFDETKPAAF